MYACDPGSAPQDLHSTSCWAIWEHSFLGRYAARKSDADVQPYRDFDPVAVPKARNPASARPLALFAPTSNFAALVFTISADVRTRRNYSVIGRR